MDKKEEAAALDVKALPVFNSTNEITRTASEWHLQIVELTEYCQAAEKTLKDLDEKIRVLAAAKKESEKLKMELSTRNKINMCNSESLRQAKNQLYKYKCELKSVYITLQRGIKDKKLKYDKIVSAYESEWEKNLARYKSDAVVVELTNAREENANLEKMISTLEKFIPDLRRQYLELERQVEEKFRLGVVEFAGRMISYASLVENQRKKKKENTEQKQQEKTTGELGKKVSIFGENLAGEEKSEDEVLTHVDVSEFDNLVVPAENLEREDVADEFTLLLLSDEFGRRQNDPGKETKQAKIDDPEVKDVQQEVGPQSESAGRTVEDNSQRIRGKSCGTKSRYFNLLKEKKARSNSSEIPGKRARSKETCDGGQRGSKQPKNFDVGDVRDEQEKQGTLLFGCEMDAEETSSNGSIDNRFGCDAHKSEEIKLMSECGGTSHSPMSVQNSKIDDDKDGFMSFKGFFAMGEESNSPTPTIFKLF